MLSYPSFYLTQLSKILSYSTFYLIHCEICSHIYYFTSHIQTKLWYFLLYLTHTHKPFWYSLLFLKHIQNTLTLYTLQHTEHFTSHIYTKHSDIQIICHTYTQHMLLSHTHKIFLQYFNSHSLLYLTDTHKTLWYALHWLTRTQNTLTYTSDN